MSIATIVSLGVLIGLVLLGIVVATRRSVAPASARSSRLGLIALGCYGLAVVAALLSSGGSAEGVGIKSILLGLPWSFVVALALGPLVAPLGLADSDAWPIVLQGLLVIPIALNAVMIYVLGAQLPVLWAPRRAERRR